ncbi:helix-turn-helix domain-containing protein [Brevibacillus choshinensis]|uniref:helix-turn-helix domain-containing protein n=1 Tax=Brevibacillus choshinensis TaxID=54911 RepID=UPI001EED8013|nr:helix-turn-helix transcriptional regulator [Brevibacillus choshinensis]
MRLPIETIGHKIRMIRKERGFTLEIMASKTGLSKGLLSQVERGISQPSLDSLWKITKALESPIIHFFEDIDQKQVHVTRLQKRRQLVFPESTGTYSLLSMGEAQSSACWRFASHQVKWWWTNLSSLRGRMLHCRHRQSDCSV